MKPRIKVYGGGCIRFLCSGTKNGLYHFSFGATMRQAFAAWCETSPKPMTDDDFADIPF